MNSRVYAGAEMLCYLLLRRLPVLFLVNLQVTVYARDLLPDKSPRFAVNVHKRLELFGSNLEALRLSSSDRAYTPDGSVNLSISLKMKKKEVSLMTHATPLNFFFSLTRYNLVDQLPFRDFPCGMCSTPCWKVGQSVGTCCITRVVRY